MCSNHLSVILDIAIFWFSYIYLVSTSPYLISILIPRGQKYSITAFYSYLFLRRICLIFSLALDLSSLLGVSIILELWNHLFLVFSTTAIRLYIQDLLSLSAFCSLKSYIYIYFFLLGFCFLWYNVFSDWSHISQRWANVIT